MATSTRKRNKNPTNKSSVIRKVLRSICQNGGRIDLDVLINKVGKFNPRLGSLEEIISNSQDHCQFIITNKEVEAHTQVKICDSYNKKHNCVKDNCRDLHLCGYFATGSFCKFGQHCWKSHNFQSDHNRQILKDFKIAFLSCKHMQTLLRLAWPQFTVPDFCGRYRSKRGCEKQKCRFLHLCRNYVMNNCTYGTRCKFAHDVFTETSNKFLLQTFKINTDYESDDLIRLIRERHEGLYRPELEVFESECDDSDNENSNETSDEEDSDRPTPLNLRPSHRSSSDIKNILPKVNKLSKGSKLQTPLVSSQNLGQIDSGKEEKSRHKSTTKSMEIKPMKDGICKDYLMKRYCDKKCSWYHCDLPYQWQIFDCGGFINVNPEINNLMENRFCEVNREPCFSCDIGFIEISFTSSENWISNHSTLECKYVQRLDVEGEPDLCDAYLISPWSWYWRDENRKWIEYGEKNTKENATSDIDSMELEMMYVAYKKGNGSPVVKFNAGSQHYSLDFISMTQTNDRYGTTKDVCRRPSKQITSDDVVRYRKEKPWLDSITYPSTWDCSIRTTSHRLVKVLDSGKTHPEYQKIKKMFESTLPHGNIMKLQRLQNTHSWRKYTQQKQVMKQKNSLKPVDERRLFHGTRQENVVDICREGFDFRLHGTRVGAAYGQGAYFASTAKYSNDFAKADSDNVKRMFIVRVLVGSFEVGKSNMFRPPLINQLDKSKGMYDSCVDNKNNPSIFVIFDNNQIYPEYLITYSVPNQISPYSGITVSSSSNNNLSTIQRTRTASNSSHSSTGATVHGGSHSIQPSQTTIVHSSKHGRTKTDLQVVAQWVLSTKIPSHFNL